MSLRLRALPLAMAFAGSLLSACGTIASSGAGSSQGGYAAAAAARQSGDEPFGLSRSQVIARSAEVLAAAAQSADTATLTRLDRYARGADADAPATRAMAARALALLAERRAKVSDAHRALLERIAAGRVKPKAPSPPAPIAFPRDEGAHFDAITEWWYLNGHLAGGAETFGYEFTLFRVGPVLLWAHVALTDETGQSFHYSRDWYAPGRTESAEDRLDTRYGAERIRAEGQGTYRLEASVGKTASLELSMESLKRPLLVGGDGNIDMPEGRDSRYYSLTRLQSSGTLRLGGRSLAVKGLTWLDHQWGPFYVSGFREIWDWFSVQADDGTDYNLFAFRMADGTPVARHVNCLDAAGQFHGGGRLEIDRAASWRSPATGLAYTTGWVLGLPDAGERITLDATVPQQELARFAPFPLDPLPVYWEGSMRMTKTRADGRQVGGFAYTETFGLKP